MNRGDLWINGKKILKNKTSAYFKLAQYFKLNINFIKPLKKKYYIKLKNKIRGLVYNSKYKIIIIYPKWLNLAPL